MRKSVLIGIAVCLAAHMGIASRPIDSLALYWPANALLLGIFLRWPATRTPLAWACATAGYLVADLMTGGSTAMALRLASANLAGVAAGIAFATLFPLLIPWQATPGLLVRLCGLAAVAAFGAGLVGATAAEDLLSFSWPIQVMYWASSEFVNGMLVLPFVLAWPETPIEWRVAGSTLKAQKVQFALLIVSLIAVVVVGGPGAVAFPMPALVWLAMSLSTWGLGSTVFASGTVAVLGNGHGAVSPVPGSLQPLLVISLRFGVSLLAIVPLAAWGFLQTQREAVRDLEWLANTDSLTGLPNRRSFMAAVEKSMALSPGAATLLYVDLDQFKRLNDTHGHAAGDAALVVTSAAIRAAVPATAQLGRLGGEEFAILVLNAPPGSGAALASNLQATLRRTTPSYLSGQLTCSIGVAETIVPSSLDALMAAADAALYQAKASGRDRVIFRSCHDSDHAAPDAWAHS